MQLNGYLLKVNHVLEVIFLIILLKQEMIMLKD